MIVLNSMHKYQPRILILKCADLEKINYCQSYSSYVFPATSFIAVTAYQNAQVTKLKIAHNPFAKGFRERQTNTRKRAIESGSAEQRSKQRLVLTQSSPEPPNKSLTEYQGYTLNQTSPSSASTSTNSSFSSGHHETPQMYQMHGFYEVPIAQQNFSAQIFDPNEVFVYDQWSTSVDQNQSSDYSLNETNELELNLGTQTAPYSVYPIYEWKKRILFVV